MREFVVYGLDGLWIAKYRYRGHAIGFCHTIGLPMENIKEVVSEDSQCNCENLNNG